MTTPKIDEHYILHEIQRRGNWTVVMRPSSFAENRLSFEKARDLVLKSAVNLRSWKYPMFIEVPKRDGGIRIRSNSIECIIDHHIIKEFWRLYQSGQFFHRFSFREDWPDYDESNKRLDILNTLFRLTEIFRFASALSAGHNIFDRGTTVEIELSDLSNRTLSTVDPSRTLSHEYECHEYSLKCIKDYSAEEIRGHSSELAIDCAVEIFNRFSWLNPDLVELLRMEQENLLMGNSWSY
jgi:hypothetical protein